MRIVPYDERYKDDFIRMNRAWISEMFVLEPEDERELGNIEPYIEKGGQIFFALDDEDHAIASCLIAPREDGDWEIMKFAADSAYQGSGAGSAVLKACIDYARKLKLPKVIIVSNKRCEQAVHLYRKYGFHEIPVDKKKFPFDRADIAFEQEFEYDDI